MRKWSAGNALGDLWGGGGINETSTTVQAGPSVKREIGRLITVTGRTSEGFNSIVGGPAPKVLGRFEAVPAPREICEEKSRSASEAKPYGTKREKCSSR